MKGAGPDPHRADARREPQPRAVRADAPESGVHRRGPRTGPAPGLRGRACGRSAATSIGCATEPDLPDAVFVEDTAVVFDELAVVTRPGAASRRQRCGPWRRRSRLSARWNRSGRPGTLDGGDVLVLGRDVFVGLSTRTNEEGVGQLRSAALAPRGYAVRPLAVAAPASISSRR